MKINTAEEHQAALNEIEELMERLPDTKEAMATPDGQRLDDLADAIKEYEDLHFPIGWEEWCKSLEQWAVKSFGFPNPPNLDLEAFRIYYDEDYTPRDAMAEDLSHG